MIVVITTLNIFSKYIIHSNQYQCFRIRPQTPGEVVEGCGICARAGGPAGEGGVALGSERAFTFDYAFEPSSCQQLVYDTCVRKLVEAALDGYNATVLAYGQVSLFSSYVISRSSDQLYLIKTEYNTC